MGSIEVGKDADLAFFDAHPLSNYGKVQKVYIDGQLYFDRQKDIADRAEKETRRKALIEKARKQQEETRRGPAGAGRRTE